MISSIVLACCLAVLGFAACQPEVVQVVATPTPGPTQTPFIVTREVPVQVVATPTLGPTQTPFIVTREVPIQVAATPEPTLTPTISPSATPIPRGSSRFDPVPLKEPGIGMVDGRTFEVTVTDVIRGSAAYDQLRAVNQFNDPPISNHEWLLFNIRVHYIDSPENEAVRFRFLDLDVLATAGATYEYHSAVQPSPSFDFSVFPGGTAEGWEVWQVRTDDPRPLLIFGADSRLLG